MQTFIGVVGLILTIYFLLAAFIPKLLLPKIRKRRKLIIFILWFFIMGGVGHLMEVAESPEDKAAREAHQQQIQIEKQMQENIFVTQLGLANLEEAKQVEDLFKSVGFKEVQEIKHEEGLDNPGGIKGYRCSADHIHNVILFMNPDKTVKTLTIAGSPLYKDGKIIGHVSDYVLSSDQEIQMRLAAENAVKKLLKAPKSAEFCRPSECKYSLSNGVGTIKGYVDAKNSFNAEIRAYYVAQFDIKSGDMIHLFFEDKQIF